MTWVGGTEWIELPVDIEEGLLVLVVGTVVEGEAEIGK